MAVQTDALDVILRVIGARTFQAAMEESRASVAGLGNEIRKTQTGFTGMTAKAKVAGEVMGTVAKIGLVGIGVAAGYAIKQSIHFQKQMTLIQTQAGASAGDVKVLHDRVLELAKVRPQGPEELAKGLYHFQSVFQNSAAAFNALEVSSKGAAVGNANLEETSTALGSALRSIYRDRIPNLQQMNDVMGTLNATIGVGNMRMDDLALALGTAVVPAGINAGLTLTDIGGALAVLTDEGQRADNAATHLRMAFTLMSATSVKAQNELSKIGIKADELGTIMHGPNGLVNSLAYVRQQLEKKFPTFGPQLSDIHDPKQALELAKRFSLISKAFGGARSSATIMLLLNNLDLLGQKTDQIHKKVGVLDHMFKVWGKTADAKTRVALSNLQSSLTKFGDSIRDNAVKWITRFINLLSAIVDHMDTLLPIFATYVGAWASLKIAIALVEGKEKSLLAIQFIKEMGLWIAEVNGAADAVTLLGIAIDTIPAFWIITAIGLIIAAFYLLITNWKTIWKWIKEHWGYVALVMAVFAPFLVIPLIIATHWKTFKNIFIGIWDSIKSVVGGGAGFVSKILDAMINRVIGALNDGISLINLAIGVYNSIPDFLRPTGKLGKIGQIGKVGQHQDTHIMKGPQMAPAQFSPFPGTFMMPTDIGTLPGGRVEQPSLRRPRSHVPEPINTPEAAVIENHNNIFLDGKQIFKSVSKHAADKKARK